MKQETELTPEQLQDFFNTHQALSLRAINEEMGLSDSYLNKIIRGDRPLTHKSIKVILPVIQKYGYGIETEENPEETLTLKQLQDFFTTHNALSLRAINEEMDLPESYLNKIIRAERSLTEKSIKAILPVIQKYGYGVKK